MSLKEYFKKLLLDKTTEPNGGKASVKNLNFVMQRYHAPHLHYDFRQALNGTLKRWAVPKGPSMIQMINA
jgi:bifunctional non-homologous end joining protein LigD